MWILTLSGHLCRLRDMSEDRGLLLVNSGWKPGEATIDLWNGLTSRVVLAEKRGMFLAHWGIHWVAEARACLAQSSGSGWTVHGQYTS